MGGLKEWLKILGSISVILLTLFGGLNWIINNQMQPFLLKLEQKVNPINTNTILLVSKIKSLEKKIDTIKNNDLKHIDDKLETNTKDIKDSRRDVNKSLTKIYELLLTMQTNKKKKQ